MTASIRRTGNAEQLTELRALLEGLADDQVEDLIRAFSLYFHLSNLAEEKERVRRVRKRARTTSAGGPDGSVEEAVRRLLREDDPERNAALIRDLSIGLVLTAHPTEARRRTTLVSLRRVFALIDQLDDQRITPDEDAEIRRRLREEISLLWRTAALRMERPSPLDEVRNVLVFFDESLFVVTPRLYRSLDRALDRAPWVAAGTASSAAAAGSADGGGTQHGPATDSGRTGTRPPAVHAYLQWGSWVGSDRDGHPRVTSATTRQAAVIGADHVLRGLVAVTTRLMNTIAPYRPDDAVDPRLADRLQKDRRELGEAYAELMQHFPGEPYRRRLGSMAERLRQTRHHLVDGHGLGAGYASPARLSEEVIELQASLVADHMERVAYGEVQSLLWQVETFGFHALSLEVRQHSEVHGATLAALQTGGDMGRTAVTDGVSAAEVLETFRAIADIQRRFGPQACQRYVISFTRRAQDVFDVLRLAEIAGLDDAAARRGAPAGVGGCPAGGRPAARPAARRRALPRARSAARRPSGGHAGLLGLDQGVGRARSRLAVAWGGIAARRRGQAARCAPDALPRTWWGHRAGRWAHEPRHPRQCAPLPGRPHQDHRAGRGGGQPLRQPRHRGAAPGAAHQRRAHGLVADARAPGAVGAAHRQRHHRGSGRALGAAPTAPWSGTTPPSRPSTSPPRPSPSCRS